jgi:pimeloyl-ACP methyl ester carboxylesterase
MMSRTHRTPWICLGMVVVAGCGALPVHVVRLDMKEVREELTSSVLTTGTPSVGSRIALQTRGLTEQYQEDPAGTLAVLHDEYVAGPGDDALLFTLSELSFDHAVRTRARPYFLASAIYAWYVLFAADSTAARNVFDPRGRLAANLYNLGLAKGFASADGTKVWVGGRTRKLPFGTIDVAFDEHGLQWGDRKLVHFVSASELGVRGLRNRHRTPGLGAPLNASTKPLDPGAKAGLIFPRAKVPATLLLLLDGDPEGLRTGRLRGRLELYTSADAATVAIAGRTVPLEFEPTSALADSLDQSEIWDSEIAGFFRGDLLQHQRRVALGSLEPYSADKVPVVLVHGTASSSARWAELVNDLSNEPEIRRRFQIWAFTYDTGNPILYSAMQLRETLTRVVQDLDPAGSDACLRQMVVVGHSQGGLLTKLTAVESGDRFWRNASDRPFDEVKMSPPVRDLLRRAIFVSPLPFVRRLVFISTPHHGSFRAKSLVRRLVRRLVRLPGDVVALGSDIIVDNPDSEIAEHLRHMPTSIDNMAPDSPFDQALTSLPIGAGVVAHSIISVKGDGPYQTGNDGVVEYRSAHIDGVESEFIVRSPHSCQANPYTIEEVRRILLEHASRVFDGDECRVRPEVP